MRQVINYNNKNWPLYVLPNYLCLEALENGYAVLLSPNGYYSSFGAPNLEYSLNKTTWNVLVKDQQVNLQAGQKIYFRGENPNGWSYGRGEADTGGTLYWNALWFSGNYNISGNVMTLIDKTGETTTIPNWYCFLRLFSNDSSGLSYNNIINADNLVLPALSLQPHCYQVMFGGAKNIVSAKFSLPAKTLTKYCYNNMFLSDSKLEEGPTIYAETLAQNSCDAMFYSTKINKVVSYAQDISATNCLNKWLYNVPATGDFYNLGGATYPSGASGIPSGWTVHTSL